MKKVIILFLLLFFYCFQIGEYGETSNVKENEVPAEVPKSDKSEPADKSTSLKKQDPAIQPITLKFKNAYLKDIFEILSKMTGVNIFFDETVQNKKINVYIDSLPFEQALDILLKTNDLTKITVDKNSMVVVPKKGDRIKNYQDMVIKTFYLTNAEAKDIINLLRTMIQTKQIIINERLNAIVLRDTKENIDMAQQIIEANDKLGTQVDIELELLEINRNRLENLGMQLGGGEGDKKALLSGLSEIKFEGSVKNKLNLSLPSVWYNLVNDKSFAKILANPRIRVTNKQKAKIMIADRIPVEISSSTKDSLGNETINTQVQYKDVGIKLDVEPNIHFDNQVEVKLSLEVSSIVEYNSKGYPLIRTRNVESSIRLKDGESKILGGLISDEERKGASKVPMLNKIPFLGTLFTSSRDQKIETEIVMRVTPYIVDKTVLAQDTASASPGITVSSSAAGKTDLIQEVPPLPKEEPVKNEPVEAAFTKMQRLVEEKSVSDEEKKEKPKDDLSNQPDAASNMIYINPQFKDVIVNEEFSLEVSVNNISDLFAVPFYLIYDPKLLQFISAKEGPFLGQDGNSTTFLFSNDINRGRVIVGLTRLGQVKGVNGSGTIMIINFKALAAGNASIGFDNASAKRVTSENPMPQSFPVTFRGAQVNVK
ncbi:MAG: secretin N-terminal domain-containing protein [bacterium]|nr:secretin N-terminal domain-containing protein [bacterium]